MFVHAWPQVLENSTVQPLWLVRDEVAEEVVTSSQQTLLRSSFPSCSVNALILWLACDAATATTPSLCFPFFHVTVVSYNPASRTTLKSTAYMTRLCLTLHPSPLRRDGLGGEDLGERGGRGSLKGGGACSRSGLYEKRILKRKQQQQQNRTKTDYYIF